MTKEFLAYMKKVLKKRKEQYLKDLNAVIKNNLVDGKFYPTHYKDRVRKTGMKKSSWGKFK